MSIEIDFRTTILSAAPNRVYPDFAPSIVLNETNILPFITYQVIGGDGRKRIDRADTLKKYRIQVNSYAKTRISCSNLSILVESLLNNATLFKAVSLNQPISVYEDEVNLYGCMQDYSIHYNVF